MLHPSLSVPFNTSLWAPQWNISLHSIIIMNGLCSVSVSLMEFTESLLLLSFLLLHRRAANPIHFHSYPSNTRFSSVPSIFINLPSQVNTSFYTVWSLWKKPFFFSSKHIWLQAQMCFWVKVYTAYTYSWRLRSADGKYNCSGVNHHISQNANLFLPDSYQQKHNRDLIYLQ